MELNKFHFALHGLCWQFGQNSRIAAVPLEQLLIIREKIRELLSQHASLAWRLHPFIKPVKEFAVYGHAGALTMNEAILHYAQGIVGPELTPSWRERLALTPPAFTAGLWLQNEARQAEERLEKKPRPDVDKDEEADEGDWLTISEAERISGINRGTISRALDAGSLKGNGKAGRARRINGNDFIRWQLERASNAEPFETDAAVKRKLKAAEGD